MTTITISGLPGTGKTTVAQLLQKETGLSYVYVGDIFRNLAIQHKMSLEEFGKYCEQHPDVDEKLDDQQLHILRKGNVIVEGRITGWLAYRNNIPAFKVLLTADIDIRAQRVVKRENGNVEVRKQEIRQREQSEVTRYKTYYDIDLSDTSIYNIIIDTTQKTPEKIVTLILKEICI